MTQVEQELHADMFTSTSRKQKSVVSNSQASESSLFGTVNRTEAYTSVEESMVKFRGPEGVQIKVHTHHTTNTTNTITSSLFSQVNQVQTQQGTVNHTINT